MKTNTKIFFLAPHPKYFGRKLWVAGFILSIFIMGIFAFGKTERAQAAGWCSYLISDYTAGGFSTGDYASVADDAACQAICKNSGDAKISCKFAATKSEAMAKSASDMQQKSGLSISGDATCPGLLTSLVTLNLKGIINCILLIILSFLGKVLAMAATLFGWVIQPSNMTNIMNNVIVYQIWGQVRDVLNIAFILVLLFSAFCTIFQVSKFSYKNILLTLIIMALLVNFSFPIARFIIDLSNVLMYYFVNNLGIDFSHSFAKITEDTSLASIIHPNIDSVRAADPVFLVAAVIFTFVLAVTLLVIAVLFVIRIVILTILIIFSPIAFTGSIVPFLAEHAKKWWNQLFKYSFFGPVMVFMLYIAIKMMGAMGKMGGSMQAIAGYNSYDSNFVSTLAFFAIPIAILWIGLGFAQQMSIIGASAITGRASKFMKLAGKSPFKAGWWGFKKTGAPGAVKQRWDQYKRSGFFGSERTAQREARLGAKIGVKGALEKDMQRRAEEFKKNNIPVDELKAMASKGDTAAALRLADDKKMDQETYDAFLRNNKNKIPTITTAINMKVKQNRNDLVAIGRSHDPLELAKPETIAGAAAMGTTLDQYLANQQMGMLSSDQWNDQNWGLILAPLPVGAPPTAVADRARIVAAAQYSWGHLNIQAKQDVRKRLSPNNAAALSTIGII